MMMMMMMMMKKELYLMRAETLLPVVKPGSFSSWPSTQGSLVLL